MDDDLDSWSEFDMVAMPASSQLYLANRLCTSVDPQVVSEAEDAEWVPQAAARVCPRGLGRRFVGARGTTRKCWGEEVTARLAPLEAEVLAELGRFHEALQVVERGARTAAVQSDSVLYAAAVDGRRSGRGGAGDCLVNIRWLLEAVDVTQSSGQRVRSLDARGPTARRVSSSRERNKLLSMPSSDVPWPRTQTRCRSASQPPIPLCCEHSALSSREMKGRLLSRFTTYRLRRPENDRRCARRS